MFELGQKENPIKWLIYKTVVKSDEDVHLWGHTPLLAEMQHSASRSHSRGLEW